MSEKKDEAENSSSHLTKPNGLESNQQCETAVSKTTVTNNRSSPERKKFYQLGAKIGIGTFSVVHVAYYRRENKEEKVACKIVNHITATRKAREVFFPRELQIHRRLHHPNIVQVFNILRQSDRTLIFMEYAENGTLLEYLKIHKRIDETEALVWFKQIVAGLLYMHALNIAHRDLKCENILLSGDWQVKLADLGFARYCVNSQGQRVLSETYCGSMVYAAPEVVGNTPYNPKMADVWSLGVILFVMTDGTFPFVDSSVSGLLKAQWEQKWAFRDKVRQQLTAELQALVERILEPDVLKRIRLPQVAADMSVDVAAAESGKLASANSKASGSES